MAVKETARGRGMSADEFKAELETLLTQMDGRQLAQLLTISSAKSIVRFSDDFFAEKAALQYLNALFLSLGYDCTLLFSARDLKRNLNLVLARDRAFAHVRDLTRDLKRARERDFKLALALARDFNLDRILDLDRALDRARYLAHDLARVRDLDLAHDLAHDLAFDLEFRSIMLSDARSLLSGAFGDLCNASGRYYQEFKWFLLGNLNKVGAEYWAVWFAELIENSFCLSEDRIDELLSLNETHLAMTIAQTSTLLLAKRESTCLFNEARLIVLGNKGSGKTTFTRRFQKLNSKMPKKKESTPGVDFHSVKASAIDPKGSDDEDFTIHIWDFAGHAVTHAAHKFFLSDRATYVIVMGGRDEGKTGTTINEWLEHITYYAGGSAQEKIKVYIVVNKFDTNLPEVSFADHYRDKFDIETDCYIDLKKEKRPGGELDQLRKKIVKHMMSHKKEIPSCIYEIKKDLEAEFAGVNNATKAQVEEIIKKRTHFPPEDILHILHAYGICFFYDKLKDDDRTLEADAVVLNPRWVTYAIYGLINFIQNDKSRTDGHIKIDEFKKAYERADAAPGSYQKHTRKLTVPDNRYPFISMLAQTFGLAYEKDHFLIFPICLPEDYPGRNRGLGDPDDSDFFVEISTKTERTNSSPVKIPKDVVPAFIVKRHTNLRGTAECLSRNGVVLEHLKHKIKAEVKRNSDYQINVLVKGADRKSCEFGADLIRDLYSVILNYIVFQEKKNRPSIKISFIDKKGHPRSEELSDLLSDDSWLSQLVEPAKLGRLRHFAQQIDQRLTLGLSGEVPIGKGKVAGEVKLNPAASDGED